LSTAVERPCAGLPPPAAAAGVFAPKCSCGVNKQTTPQFFCGHPMAQASALGPAGFNNNAIQWQGRQPREARFRERRRWPQFAGGARVASSARWASRRAGVACCPVRAGPERVTGPIGRVFRGVPRCRGAPCRIPAQHFFFGTRRPQCPQPTKTPARRARPAATLTRVVGFSRPGGRVCGAPPGGEPVATSTTGSAPQP